MAVTLQLARLTETELIKCLHSRSALESLLSFAMAPQDRYLDLNWEVNHLKKLLVVFSQPEYNDYVKAIEGSHDFPESLGEFDVEEQPTFNRAGDVEKILTGLKAIEIGSLLERLPSSIDEMNQILGSQYDQDPHNYLFETFDSLLRFYSEAARAGQGVVCWWD